jgi:hypothetical protein
VLIPLFIRMLPSQWEQLEEFRQVAVVEVVACQLVRGDPALFRSFLDTVFPELLTLVAVHTSRIDAAQCLVPLLDVFTDFDWTSGSSCDAPSNFPPPQAAVDRVGLVVDLIVQHRWPPIRGAVNTLLGVLGWMTPWLDGVQVSLKMYM